MGNPTIERFGVKCRWFGKEDTACLRFVGYADEISTHIEHTGWFTHDDGWLDPDDKLRGVVYQVSGKDREPRYLAGYADPYNDNAAFLCLTINTSKTEAAMSADWLAECMAESERDYRRASDAGMRCQLIEEETKETRSKALLLCAELRQSQPCNGLYFPAIAEAIRQKVFSSWRSICALREERDKLVSEFGHEQGFRDV